MRDRRASTAWAAAAPIRPGVKVTLCLGVAVLRRAALRRLIDLPRISLAVIFVCYDAAHPHRPFGFKQLAFNLAHTAPACPCEQSEIDSFNLLEHVLEFVRDELGKATARSHVNVGADLMPVPPNDSERAAAARN